MQRPALLLVDRSQLFREGVKTLLTACNFAVCGEASTLGAAIEQLRGGLRADLILFDLDDGDDDEIDSLQQLRITNAEPRIVVLTNELSCRRLAQFLAAGADGYLLKDMSPEALAQSLRLVLLGEKVFPTNLAPLLVNGSFDLALAMKPATPPPGLSEREVQILTCLVNGFSNKIIAKHLELTEGTVKIHLKGLLRKLNARNRTQAAVWALNTGIGTRSEPAMLAAPERRSASTSASASASGNNGKERTASRSSN